MEKYLQELDKINELLVFTDKRPFQLWNFFANNFFVHFLCYSYYRYNYVLFI